MKVTYKTMKRLFRKINWSQGLQLIDAKELLQEWLNTPFFETKEEWQEWANEFRPKVEAVIKNIEDKK